MPGRYEKQLHDASDENATDFNMFYTQRIFIDVYEDNDVLYVELMKIIQR